MSEKKSPFDYINSIFYKNKLDPESYVPFMANRGLSYQQDCVYWANEMNQRWNLDKDMQYDFLFYSVRKGKRNFTKWAKANKEDEDLLLISEYYQVNHRRAREILSLINKDEIELIRERTFKGGR